MSLYGALAEHERQGKEVALYRTALSADGTLEIDTGFAEIDSVQVSINQGSEPTTTVTNWEATGNTVTIHGWKVTGSNNNTLVASDGEETLDIMIVGRRR